VSIKLGAHQPDPIESKAKAFARSFLNKCRQSKLTDKEIVSLIEYAVNNWGDFREEKKSKTGAGVKAEYANLKDMMRFSIQLISYWKDNACLKAEQKGKWTKEGVFIPEGWED